MYYIMKYVHKKDITSGSSEKNSCIKFFENSFIVQHYVKYKNYLCKVDGTNRFHI